MTSYGCLDHYISLVVRRTPKPTTMVATSGASASTSGHDTTPAMPGDDTGTPGAVRAVCGRDSTLDFGLAGDRGCLTGRLGYPVTGLAISTDSDGTAGHRSDRSGTKMARGCGT